MESNISNDIINKLRSDEQLYKSQIDECKSDLQRVKSDIEKWRNVASEIMPKGYETIDEVADSLRKRISSVEDLKEVLKKQKRTETALVTAIHMKDKEIADLKSEFQSLKKQLTVDRSTQKSWKSLVLDPITYEQFESLKNNAIVSTKKILELEEEAAKSTKTNVDGNALLKKCRIYEKENEETDDVYDTVSDLKMKIALQNLKGVELRSQFNVIHQSINDLLLKLDTNNRIISDCICRL
ncbi:hypothetical protein ZOSMA_161G00010 [Zostera marina]|uniref:Uncharacterized protein n=1 Tax=Zostera marina TaxID=29655 RepID=A0A0K9PU33_ZOSMR|nr:hypothetical protein ZOSMA_225G00010 [Zostera marina]KMZ72553.1 hypothetical protein ZOSMA_161G00010 [Zostera marina]